MDPSIALVEGRVEKFNTWFPSTTTDFSLKPAKEDPKIQPKLNSLFVPCALRTPESIIWANIDAVFNLSGITSPIEGTNLSYRKRTANSVYHAIILASDSASEYFSYRNPSWYFHLTDLQLPLMEWFVPPAYENINFYQSPFDPKTVDKLPVQVNLVISGVLLANERILNISSAIALSKLIKGGNFVLRFHNEYADSYIFEFLSRFFDYSTAFAPLSRREVNDRYFVGLGFKGIDAKSLNLLRMAVSQNMGLNADLRLWFDWYLKLDFDIPEVNMLSLYAFWAIPSPRRKVIS
jgi:hypothetical protein